MSHHHQVQSGLQVLICVLVLDKLRNAQSRDRKGYLNTRRVTVVSGSTEDQKSIWITLRYVQCPTVCWPPRLSPLDPPVNAANVLVCEDLLCISIRDNQSTIRPTS